LRIYNGFAGITNLKDNRASLSPSKIGGDWFMMPIGPLMIEHRLIERIVPVLKEELRRINETSVVSPVLIESAVDFFRTYADRTHHGKEEDILFRELKKKQLSPEHQKIMDELIEEHVYARRIVGNLLMSKDFYMQGNTNALKDVIGRLNDLIKLYPAHIEKEDKRFFIPVMDYFSKQEQDDMLQESWEFDRKMIHEKYENIVEKFEGAG
jgi:hemerythrin-like domain-containing protein